MKSSSVCAECPDAKGSDSGDAERGYSTGEDKGLGSPVVEEFVSPNTATIDRSHLCSSIGRTEVFFIQCFNRSTCGLCCMSTCEISWGFLDTMRISIASGFPFWPHVFSFLVVHPLTSLDDPSPNGVPPLNQHIYHFPRGIGKESSEEKKTKQKKKKSCMTNHQNCYVYP